MIIKQDRENFYMLNFLDKFMMGHKGYIAGGCFKNIFNGEKIKDIDIYRQLAENVGKTQSQVERNIRHTIEVTFYNIRPEMAKKYFGNSVGYNKVKPCNAQFLATIAEHTKNKELYTE